MDGVGGVVVEVVEKGGWDGPVCFLNSSRMSSRLLFLGMLPTKRRMLATDKFTFKYLPLSIS